MIQRVRIDDMLWASSDPRMQGKELQKFTKYVNWCRDANVYCVPNVLCQDIEAFPEAIEMLDEFEQVDLHGWTHGPYGSMPLDEVCQHLDLALEWFEKNTNHSPIRWVTPHGANSWAIQDGAAKFNLVVETCEWPVIDQKVADGRLKESHDLGFLDGRVIMSHSWERGLALYRITQSIKHGGVSGAIEATRDTLDPKSYEICWKGWRDE